MDARCFEVGGEFSAGWAEISLAEAAALGASWHFYAVFFSQRTEGPREGPNLT